MSHGKKERLQRQGSTSEPVVGGKGSEGNRQCRAGKLSVPPMWRVASGHIAQSDKSPGEDRPTSRPPVVVGGTYRLRNGAKVHIVTCREIAANIDGQPGRYRFFVGHFSGTKQKCTWALDGRYSPVADGPLDIVARAR